MQTRVTVAANAVATGEIATYQDLSVGQVG